DVNGFTFLNDGSLLLTLNQPATISGLGLVDDSDIMRFIPSSLGETTAGRFELYFDGSDVGLETNGEDIDVINVLADGSLLISTLGNIRHGSIISKDEDLARFIPTSLGNNTSGSWELYFDGSAVALTTAYEDVWAAHVDNANNQIYLSTRGVFDVSGLAGKGGDIFICNVNALGTRTACRFSMFWQGNAYGFGSELIDGLYLGTGPRISIAAASMADSEEDAIELYDEVDDDILEDENGEELILDQQIFLPIMIR
ncbi:MAG: hypothetical protein KDE31_19585, partial [Caldilineaceae bacterium]|nr:hypothetical protein [Caldilineaceae bacterium]